MAQQLSRTPTLFAVAEAARDIRELSARDAKAIGYFPSPLCHIAFPTSQQPGKSEYVRKSGGHVLSILTPSFIGLPYGLFPRLMISWISTEAKRLYVAGKDSSKLQLGASCAKWLQEVHGVRMLSGGRTGNITRFRGAYVSLVASTIHYSYNLSGKLAGPTIGPLNYQIARNVLWHPTPQLVSPVEAFNSTLQLGEQFHEDIINRGVPIDFRILKALKAQVLAIDIYLWATFRANGRNRNFSVNWESLRMQFGPGYDTEKPMWNFKRRFGAAAKLVHLLYPEFNFRDQGVVNGNDLAHFNLIGPSVQVKARTLPELPPPQQTLF